ncbi:hypothetical protein EYF80_037493 [Liparis tanakae]|uniref:Uncharacterized protein n=1 Tax=Liparis tanakae TaxID=230148 RepID=A0A4Z2GG05_9TELE|nr:hypothetical protein EYF80_037493 [Liparis tanakae]
MTTQSEKRMRQSRAEKDYLIFHAHIVAPLWREFKNRRQQTCGVRSGDKKEDECAAVYDEGDPDRVMKRRAASSHTRAQTAPLPGDDKQDNNIVNTHPPQTAQHAARTDGKTLLHQYMVSLAISEDVGVETPLHISGHI